MEPGNEATAQARKRKLDEMAREVLTEIKKEDADKDQQAKAEEGKGPQPKGKARSSGSASRSAYKAKQEAARWSDLRQELKDRL